MTMVFSLASARLITMTVDSAITNEFSDRTEYDTGRKAYPFNGIGCVTTWGERSGNKVNEHLKSLDLDPSKHSIVDLVEFVRTYLFTEYLPHQHALGEVGYHIAGFDRNHRPRLYHVFWSFDRPRIPNQTQPRYGTSDHCPASEGQINFVFNGRNDLAGAVVNALNTDRLMNPQATKFKLENPIDCVCFGDFVARFASEITPQVGPDFFTYIIAPDNKITYVKNETYCPIERALAQQKLAEAGFLF